jgi:hypothetical protein
MKQVIIFRERKHESIQKTINSWIVANHTTNEILDIKLNSYSDTHSTSLDYFTAMIIYEKKNSN